MTKRHSTSNTGSKKRRPEELLKGIVSSIKIPIQKEAGGDVRITRRGRPAKPDSKSITIKQPIQVIHRMREMASDMGINIGSVYTLAAKSWLEKGR